MTINTSGISGLQSILNGGSTNSQTNGLTGGLSSTDITNLLNGLTSTDSTDKTSDTFDSLNMGVNTTDSTNSFDNYLKDALGMVTDTSEQSENSTNQLLTGSADSVHEVMANMQKEELSLQLTMQVRNKIVDSYQEVMRMNI